MKLNPFLAFLKSNGYLLSGYFAGIYEWDTVEDAENYANSFAMRFSRRRSAPGTFTCKVTPGGEE